MIGLPSLFTGNNVKMITKSGSSVARFFITYLSECELCSMSVVSSTKKARTRSAEV